MKLCIVGKVNKEKPALVDKAGNYRDLSKIVKDFNPATLNFETIEKLKSLDLEKLSILDNKQRIGACVSIHRNFWELD